MNPAGQVPGYLAWMETDPNWGYRWAVEGALWGCPQSASMSSTEEAETEDLGGDSSITVVELGEVVKKLPGGKVLGMEVWNNTCGIEDWGGVSHF